MRTRGLPPSDGRRPRPPAAVCRSVGVCASKAQPTGGGGLLCSSHAVVATCYSAGVVGVFQCMHDRSGSRGLGQQRRICSSGFLGPLQSLTRMLRAQMGLLHELHGNPSLCTVRKSSAYAAIRLRHAPAGRQGERLLNGLPENTHCANHRRKKWLWPLVCWCRRASPRRCHSSPR